MRANRIFAGLLAVVMTFTLPFLAGTSASAKGKSTSAQAEQVSTTFAKPRVGAKIIKKRGKLFMVGSVRPRRAKVVIEKTRRCNKWKNGTVHCRKWKRHRKVRIKNGRYKVRVYAPRRGNMYWRARVGRVKSPIWRTYTRRY